MNIKTNKIIKNVINKGYERVNLYINNKRKNFQVHRLVALAFIDNPEHKITVNHKDGNKRNNDVSNLEWATYSEQVIHAIKFKLKIPLRGEDNPSSKLTDDIVKDIAKLFESNEMTVPEISDILNINQSILRDILHRNTWSHITKDYDFSRYDKLGCSIYTDDQIHLVCKLLEENDLTVTDISSVTNVDSSIIRHIINKKAWRRISDAYNILNYTKVKNINKNSEEQIHHVCRLLEENKLSLNMISEITGIQYKMVSAILNGSKWNKISSQYTINYTAFKK